MGEIPIEFVTFSRYWARQITCGGHLNKLLTKRPFSAQGFFLLKRPFFQKKSMGGAPMMRPCVFFPAHDPYIPNQPPPSPPVFSIMRSFLTAGF